jgi:acylglycerol lipase
MSTSAVVQPVDSKITVQGTTCCLHTWNGDQKDQAKGVVLIFHGFGAHGLYPTVRYAAQRLAAANYVVVAPDLPGHGTSEGLPGYIASASALLDVGVEIATQVQAQYASSRFFLLGSSMGGCISLAVAQKWKESSQNDSTTAAASSSLAGVVLLAPMLMLGVGTPARYLLSGLAMLPVVSTLAVIPSNSTALDGQYRDPGKRQECADDTLSYSGKLRVGSASTCVELTCYIQSKFTSIDVPFLLLVAEEDVVVKNQGSFDLMEQSPSKDKTMKGYPALHGLLCEPKPLVDQIQDEMVEWINARA